jgi:hypothetical protein
MSLVLAGISWAYQRASWMVRVAVRVNPWPYSTLLTVGEKVVSSSRIGTHSRPSRSGW